MVSVKLLHEQFPRHSLLRNIQYTSSVSQYLIGAGRNALLFAVFSVVCAQQNMITFLRHTEEHCCTPLVPCARSSHFSLSASSSCACVTALQRQVPSDDPAGTCY